jgi:hypothetical protein
MNPIGYYICRASNLDRARISMHASRFLHAKQAQRAKKRSDPLAQQVPTMELPPTRGTGSSP